MASTLCPDCGGEARFVGSIPDSYIFAGSILRAPLAGGGLYQCTKCGLGFRSPRLSKDALDYLYAQGSDKAWTDSIDRRPDWRIAHDWLLANIHTGAAVLDIGCFDGAFLESLAQNYRCFGIEIHPEARHRAAQRGVEIVGRDFFDLEGQFDCIVAFDVIEHVESPRRFLEFGVDHLKSGGRLLVSTGNFDSFTFRFMGSRYWYCSIAEHISFISPAWVRRQVPALGVKIEGMTFFSHANFRFRQSAKQVAANVLYRFCPRLFASLRRMGMGRIDVRRFPESIDYPPGWMSAKDHFLFVLRKA